jgi:hypothetical protein
LLSLVALIPLALTACGGGQNIARSEKCQDEQITFSLAPGIGRTDRVMEDLEDDAKVRLEYQRSASPVLFIYTLSAKGRDPGCNLALARLRQDSRVRFAEPDNRRHVHGLAR